MTWSGHDRFERRGYHHGNLREALVEAALELVAEKGPAGLSITEAARRAGVSAAAPYRHFRDADALLAEVAGRGFEQFTQALSAAWNEGRPDPMAAFTALGRAYLNFARSHPAFYAVMFETHLAADTYPELAAAGDRAFQILRDAAEILAARVPQPDRPPSLMVALHVWSLSHGIASLFCRAGDARRRLPMAPEDLLEAGVLVYLQGLGLIGPTPKR
ncbi:MAG TPA: TetR/AcrR family transcriptional regulator [Acetobacteraceae bacterium]